MNKLSRKAIGGIVLASILVAGMVTLMPNASADLTALDKIGTIINILLNIQEDLSDKLKLIVAEDWNEVQVEGNGIFIIDVEAERDEDVLEPFNLKELYVCGTLDDGGGSISVNLIRIELIEEGPDADIVIREANGGALEGATIVSGEDAAESCADILTLVAENTGRAGAAGLGSDNFMQIVLGASAPPGNVSTIVHVKCIAFVPQIVEELECDVEVPE
ncbi:MAG: hypothetical protein ACRD38_06685 [Nitrososphaerales archaeon]